MIPTCAEKIGMHPETLPPVKLRTHGLRLEGCLLLVEVFCVARVISQSALNRASLNHLSCDSSSLLHKTRTRPLHYDYDYDRAFLGFVLHLLLGASCSRDSIGLRLFADAGPSASRDQRP